MAALLVITPLGLVFYHLLVSGIGSVNWDFFTHLPKPVGEVGGGMANAIVGSAELLGLASLIGVTVGVLGGVYLAEYGGARTNAIAFMGLQNGGPEPWTFIAGSVDPSNGWAQSSQPAFPRSKQDAITISFLAPPQNRVSPASELPVSTAPLESTRIMFS